MILNTMSGSDRLRAPGKEAYLCVENITEFSIAILPTDFKIVEYFSSLIFIIWLVINPNRCLSRVKDVHKDDRRLEIGSCFVRKKIILVTQEGDSLFVVV